MARTMNSGVKCAYWVTRARLASSPGETSCSSSSPRVSQPFGKDFVGRSAEEVVGEVARAERREEGEAFLFFRSRVPRLLLDLAHQLDRRDVVRRARLPVGAKAASPRQTEVARRHNDRSGGVVLSLGDRFVDRLAEGEAGIEAHRGGEGGRVEERQAQLVGGGLHCDWDLSGARDRPVGA